MSRSFCFSKPRAQFSLSLFLAGGMRRKSRRDFLLPLAMVASGGKNYGVPQGTSWEDLLPTTDQDYYTGRVFCVSGKDVFLHTLLWLCSFRVGRSNGYTALSRVFLTPTHLQGKEQSYLKLPLSLPPAASCISEALVGSRYVTRKSHLRPSPPPTYQVTGFWKWSCGPHPWPESD